MGVELKFGHEEPDTLRVERFARPWIASTTALLAALLVLGACSPPPASDRHHWDLPPRRISVVVPRSVPVSQLYLHDNSLGVVFECHWASSGPPPPDLHLVRTPEFEFRVEEVSRVPGASQPIRYLGPDRGDEVGPTDIVTVDVYRVIRWERVLSGARCRFNSGAGQLFWVFSGDGVSLLPGSSVPGASGTFSPERGPLLDP
jgi:hypothetical protein